MSHNEYVSLVVQYVHNMKIQEHLIPLNSVHSTSRDAFENVAMALLGENNVEIDNIQRQDYDGVANMSEHYKGLQSRIFHKKKKINSHICALSRTLLLSGVGRKSNIF